MKREVFLKRIIQAGLLALLAFVIFFLRGRIASGPDCTGCPGADTCPGKSACNRN